MGFVGEQNLLKANYLRNLVGILKLLPKGIICHDKKLLGQAIKHVEWYGLTVTFKKCRVATPLTNKFMSNGFSEIRSK